MKLQYFLQTNSFFTIEKCILIRNAKKLEFKLFGSARESMIIDTSSLATSYSICSTIWFGPKTKKNIL